MKYLLLIACYCLLALAAQAQVKKQKLGFIPYSNPTTAQNSYRQTAYENLYETATRIFINTQRFEVLDRSKFNIVKLEKNYQKGEDFINSEIVAQGKVLAAEVLAVAKITALSIDKADDGKGYSAFFTVELKQIDVETTKALNALQLKGEWNDDIGASLLGNKLNPVRAKSAEEAISKAVVKMEAALEKWIKDNFPIKMKIIEKRDAEKVLIAQGGKDLGLTTRSRMRVAKITKMGDSGDLVETVARLKFDPKDGVGAAVTKFQLVNKSDWPKIEAALRERPNGVFIMEDVK